MSAHDEINRAEADSLKHFTVCLRHPGATLETFACWAEDDEHAEEQARSAYPETDILGAIETMDIENPYYTVLEHDSEQLATTALGVVDNWEAKQLADHVRLLDALLDELPWFDREGTSNAVKQD